MPMFSGMLMALTLLSACPAEQNSKNDRNDVEAQRQEARSNKMQSRLDTATLNFLGKTQQGGMTEIELGQLALKRSSNQQVKNFANQLINDHSKANQEVGDLASLKQATLPNALSTEQQAIYNRLQSLSGSAFDREFLKVNIKAHQDTIDSFQEQATYGPDMDVRAMADKTLPTLKMHLQMAQGLAAKLK